MMKRKFPTWALSLLSLFFWVGVWWLIAAIFAKPLLLPTPIDAVKALLSLMGTGTFYLTIATSLLRILAGIAVALIGGTLLALATVKSRTCHFFFSPVLTFFKATPVASIIFLMMLWVGRANVPFFIAFMMALPIVWSNVREGLLATDKKLLEMARVFGVPRTRILQHVHLPSLTPYFLAAARSAISLSWKAGVAAEVLCTPERSIGRAIYEGKMYLLTDELFAWTLVVVAISMLVEWLALYLLARAQGKYAKEQKESAV